MKFKIYETRVETYSCEFEAENVEAAQDRYEIGVPTQYWHHISTDVEQGDIEELDDDGTVKLIHGGA